MRQFTFSIVLLSIATLTGCESEDQTNQSASDSYYTCPMHPSVVSSTPGSCPVCNMSLIKVEKDETDHAGAQGSYITIDKRQQELAGIETDTVGLRNISSASILVGTVAMDEARVRIISSRAPGRIDRLFVKNTGATLGIGSPLYSIYSEQLQADEKEYLSLLDKSKSTNAASTLVADLLNAARNKLLLWGLTEKQVSNLEKSGSSSPLITFYSSEAGYVTQVNITEGMYVQEGSALFEVTSLDQVWVEAQLYSNEVSATGESKTFQIFSENNPEKVFKGTLVYNNPSVEDGKRVNLLRIRITNSGGQFIPGTLVSVIPEKSSTDILVVPKSAVLLEKMKTVWVLAHDNTFEQRMVNTGLENSLWVEIISGLKEGELVVKEGAYLISSEYTLKSGAGQRHDH